MNQVDALRCELDRILTPLLGDASRICIIDPPGYPNIGDSVIFLGELDFINRHLPSAQIYFYDKCSYSTNANRFIDSADILLINGGGNFGDIWPDHHRLRKKILKSFRHKKIIQLPQSIHFSDSGELELTREIISRQSDFTLLVRDEISFESANHNFDCEIALCPDMAFAMNSTKRKPPSEDIFALLRTDKEAYSDHREIIRQFESSGFTYSQGDWIKQPMSTNHVSDYIFTKLTKRLPALTVPFNALMLYVRRRYAEDRVRAGINMLSSGKIVVTDRLHGHIFSLILQIPHIFFDSLDGKISAFHRTWTHRFSNAVLLANPEEIHENACKMLREINDA